MIQRKTHLKPGYDCRRTCNHTPKGDHGINADEWWFTVIAGDSRVALTLVVVSSDYPPTVDHTETMHWSGRKFYARNFIRHSAYAWTREQVLGFTGECEYLGRCNSESMSILYAEDFTQMYLVYDAKLEQPESFWLAMERELVQAISDISEARLADGDLRWKVCSCCKGERVVPL